MVAYGDRVVLNRRYHGRYIGGYGYATLEEGTVGYVSHVSSSGNSIYFRTARPNHMSWESEEVSVPVSPSDVTVIDPDDPNYKEPRKLGEIPEDDPNAISPSHPGLRWFWEDAAKLATKMGHCATYDTMCDQLGVPGRERDFTVKLTINGIEVSSKVKAHSQKEADELVKTKLLTSTDNNV